MAEQEFADVWEYFNNYPDERIAECKLCRKRIKSYRSFNLRQHLNRVHNSNKEVKKYFEINVLDNLAKCKTCTQKLKNRVCNLKLHMRRLHNIEINEGNAEGPNKPRPSTSMNKRKTAEHDSNNAKRLARRLTIKMNKKIIVRSVFGLIVEDGVSPHLFSSKHIAAILRPMCEAISEKQGKEFKIDETEIERILSSMTNYIRNDFSDDLHCRLLSIKIDTDPKASDKTFCLSAQFICNGEIQKRKLGLIDLNDEYQLEEDNIKEILYKFNIDSNQVISVSWDNTMRQSKKQVKNSEYLNEIEKFEFYPKLYIGDIKVSNYLSSLAQLCLFDVIKNSNIFQSFLDSRNLIKFLSDESNGYYQHFDLNNCPIPELDSPWKLGSTCQMMNDLNEARKFLQNVTFTKLEQSEDQFTCNENLWLFIEAFCKSTTYLQKTILKYCNEELHIGDFYAQWLKCKLLTEKLLSSAHEPNNLLSTTLKEVLKSIENRTKELLCQDYIVACLYLDPRFQCTLNPDQNSRAVEYLKKLWCRAKLYIIDDTETNEETAAPAFKEDEDEFLNEFLGSELKVKDERNSHVFRKIEELKLTFQVVITNVLTFWESQKAANFELQVLSSILFAIPATEIYNKKHSGHIYRLDCNSKLSSFTKENLLNMRVNAHLLDDALACLHLADERSNAQSNLSDIDGECQDLSNDGNSNASSSISTNLTENTEFFKFFEDKKFRLGSGNLLEDI